MKMQFLAVPMGVAAAFAMLSKRRCGSRKYPLSAAAAWRKNMRRWICGSFQNCVPFILLQSIPKRSFIFARPSVTKQEVQFVDTGPGQIFDSGISGGGRGGFLQKPQSVRTLVVGRLPRKEGQKHLVQHGRVVGDFGDRQQGR